MAKAYLFETRYSYLEDLRQFVRSGDYEAEDASTAFEAQVQTDLASARTYHLQGELGLALDGYQRLQALILKTVNPQLPLQVSRSKSWVAPRLPELMDTLIGSSADTLARIPITAPTLPPGVISPDPAPDSVIAALQPFLATGMRSGVADDAIVDLRDGAAAVDRGAWDEARDAYQRALDVVGDHAQLRAYVQHDVGLLLERTGDPDGAKEQLTTAAKTLAAAHQVDGQVAVLTSLVGLAQRQGDEAGAAERQAQVTALARKNGIHDLTVQPSRVGTVGLFTSATTAPEVAVARPFGPDVITRIDLTTPHLGERGLRSGQPAHGAVAPEGAAAPAVTAGGPVSASADVPTLLSLRYLETNVTATSLTLLDGEVGGIDIKLGDTRKASLTGFYETLKTTTDIDLLMPGWLHPTVFVAYMPYTYFFVLPMSIGDCFAEMGDHAAAERHYLAALSYPYLNQNVEVVKVWTKLADVALAWGDSLYRSAGEDTTAFGPAAAQYAKIVQADGTLPAGSNLYASAAFAGLATRAQAVLDAADPEALEENPAIVAKILQARMRLQQIGAELDFFGFSADYVPPFGWEYLQTTARYFAQHAATLEQSYIQFKSQAENEQLRRDQMEQQVEMASASVQLEQRSVEEANAGLGVAAASLNYAQQQRANAQSAKDDFGAVRYELEELSELEAWSQAAAMDEDDEVKQTISNFTYYNADSKRRSDVLADLGRRRAQITGKLEADRLQREVAAAKAYVGVAQAQVAQAQARIASAQQRVVVAQLKQRAAEDNRDFLDMREFSSRLWYDLARTLRSLSDSYLDMAIQVALLMERAYALETGRQMHKIRLDYRSLGADQLLGADFLQRDIDFFTVDYLTSIQSKKAPMKVTVSLADTYPQAFGQLKATGRAMFATTVEQFDRLYPGYYLHKVRNVELVFVGLTGSGGLHGTLRNIGVSSFRDQTGALRDLVYPADVMPISQYDVRQDALVFRSDPSRLRLFENNGLATMWQIELPPGANDFDPAEILDVQLVLFYDAFFDPGLEATVKADLPTEGSGAKSLSLRMNAPDELFFLRSQGEGLIDVTDADLPRSQRSLQRTALTIRLLGAPDLVGGLTFRLTSDDLGTELTVTTEADGTVAGNQAADPLGDLIGRDVVDRWKIHVLAADNPGKAAVGDIVDLRDLTDVQAFEEYDFTWR